MAEDGLRDGVDDDPHDDYWNEMPGQRRDLTTIGLVAGAVAILVIITALVLVRGGGDDTTTPDVTEPTTSADAARPTATTQPSPTWQGGINGEPVGFPGPDHLPDPGTRPGVYIWLSFDGWHIRVVKGDNIGDVGVSVEGNDKATVYRVQGLASDAAQAEGNAILMDIRTAETSAGVDFDYGFFTNKVQFTVSDPKGRLPVDRIFYGAGAAPTTFNPATFEKR